MLQLLKNPSATALQCDGSCYHLYRRKQARDAINGDFFNEIDGRAKEIERLTLLLYDGMLDRCLASGDWSSWYKLEERIQHMENENFNSMLFHFALLDSHNRFCRKQ